MSLSSRPDEHVLRLVWHNGGVRVVDLSHVIRDGLPVMPGLPPPRVGALLDHEASRGRYGGRAEFHLGRVEMAGNTGTCVDVAFHRHVGREDLAAFGIGGLVALPAVALDPRRPFDPHGERGLRFDVPREASGRAVLLRTGWDARFGEEGYWTRGPYLSAATLEELLAAEVALVGVDFANVDDTSDLARPAHTRLLDAGIPIVESLTGLGALPPDGFRFSAAPLKLARVGSFACRAFATVDG